MNPFRFTTIAHGDRDLLGPLSDAAVSRLLASMSPPVAPRVLDVGCGKGEMLIRAIERWGGTGLGIDPNPAFIADAVRHAAARSAPGAIEWRECTRAAAALAPEAFDVAMCCGATHAFESSAAAIDGLSALAKPGGFVLIGDGYWRREPDPEFLEALGATRDDHTSSDQRAAIIRSAGLELVAHHESTLAEWDDYEGAYAAAMERWLAAHPDDDDHAAFRERIDRWQGIVARWGRETLGFRVDVARRPATRKPS